MPPKHGIAERPTPTGADLVARRLAREGIKTAFGVPGGEILAFVAALERAGIRFVLARHENAAGFMAEACWHATGAPGLLVTTLGPGLANAANVIAHAHQDRVPLIVVTGCIDEAMRDRFTHQVFDHAALVAPITKARFRAAVGTEDLVADKALAIALKGRPGPVLIDLPIGVAEAPVAERPLVVSARPAPGLPDLGCAAAMLATARRPVVLAGLDLLDMRGAAALDRFLTRTGAPLLTTYKAKGVVPETDPRVVGAVGLSPLADRIVAPLIAAADLIILAGYDPIEMRAGWIRPFGATPVIDIVAEALPHGMHEATVLLEGDVAGILDRLGAPAAAPAWPEGEPAAVRARMRDAFQARDAWGPAQVFATARAIAPDDVVATADSGAHRILLSQMWTCAGPRRLLQSTGFCTMGAALPLAAGAAMAEKGRPVLAFVGDAGLEMGLGELATLRDHRLPVVVVVLVDNSLALIEMKQRSAGLPNAGVDFAASDFAAVAVAMGGRGVSVRDAEGLARALHDGFAHPGFTVIAAEIDRCAYDGAF